MTKTLDINLTDALISLEIWCEKIDRISANFDFKDFLSNEILQLALSMAVSQTGEISGRILRKWPEFAANNPSLQLSGAHAMRHRIFHVYEQLDTAILWDTVKNSVPEMRIAIVSILRESGEVES